MIALLVLLLGGCDSDLLSPGHERVAQIAVESGDAQTGLAGEALAEPLQVRVTDTDGSPFDGWEVTWTVTSGSGGFTAFGCEPVTSATTRTGPDGTSAVSFMPSGVGLSTVTAEVGAGKTLNQAVTFNANANGHLIALIAGGHDWFTDCDFGPERFEPRFTVITVGSTVEWVNPGDFPVVQLASTSEPPGGAAFHSDMLSSGERFRFVPETTGIWEYVDLVSGHTGALTVVPSG